MKEYVDTEISLAIRTDKHIFFTEHTECIKSTSAGLPIEKYAFDFVAIQEITEMAKDNRFLIGNMSY